MAMLATPIIGFIVGAGGYMSLAVLKDTYTGKMPGPASAGYFIAAITGATVLGLTVMSRKQGYLAEQKTARVRTMSGKPVSETLRKLKQDKNLSAKDARNRKEIKAEGELEYEGNCSWCKKPSVKVREVEYGGGGSICPNCHHSYRKLGYNPHKPQHPFKKGAESQTFEAPKKSGRMTMTELQAKRKVIALMKPYWLKELKTQRGPKLSRKQYTAKYGDDYYDANMEDWEWWDYHVKTVQSGKYGDADTGGDTILREALPYSYWTFINRNITWEGSEKYDDEPYETMYLDIDFCIYDRTTPWSEWSASDKRKLNKLEKRWEEEEDMDFMDYIEQKDAIEHKYNKTVQHRTEASKMNCKHCGPYFKNRANIKNWDVLGMLEDENFFYHWEYPASLKKQVKALIPALKGIKPKPKARAKKTTTKPKAKAAKKTTTRKAKPKAKAKAKTLAQIKDTLTAKDRKAFDNHAWRYWDSPDSIWNEQHTYHQRITDRLKKNGFKKSGMSMETMIKKIPSAWTKFYNKWWAVGKSNFAYFGHPNLIVDNIVNWSDLLDVEIWTKDNQIVMVWQFKHHDHGDASPWLEQTFTLPTKPKAKAAKKTTTRKSKAKAKTGRKAPTISATRRKIGTRMRGNDGKMWEVKKSGKSQRWMAGAENQNWGGNPEGQLAQALERARTSPAPPPLEITELPKICQLCGDESPQAFGLYDEDEQLLGELWACDEGCAQPLADSQNLSFGAEGDYNDFIEGLEAHLTEFGNLDHLDSEYSDGVLSGSFSVDIDEPDKFGDVDFDAEGDIDNFHEEPIMVIGESTNLPDADSWIIYMHDTDDREQDSRFADLFFVRGPGQFIRTSNYQKTAKVIGGYAPFQITQNVSRDGWLGSSTTIANYTGKHDARSLSVGDVVCDADTGRCFIVANSGYLPLEPSELFEAPSARHSLNRFKPSTAPKKAGYWRKKGKESVFRRNKSSSSGE